MDIGTWIASHSGTIQAVGAALVVVAVDFVLGVGRGITAGQFSMQRLPDQLVHFALPYLAPLGLALLAYPQLSGTAYEAGIKVAAATVVLKGLDDLRRKLTTAVPAKP